MAINILILLRYLFNFMLKFVKCVELSKSGNAGSPDFLNRKEF